MNLRLAFRRLALFALLFAPAVVTAQPHYHITPTGAGTRTGHGWADARPASELQATLDGLRSGQAVYLGSGTYDNVALRLAASNATIAGVDTGGGLPVFVSDFDKANPANTGATFLTVARGTSHVFLKDLVLQRYRQGVRLEGRHKGISVVNVDVTESRDAFWIDGGATAAEPKAGSSQLAFSACDVQLFTKRGFRVFNGNAGVFFADCHADAGGKAWGVENFPIGFHVIGGEGGVIDSAVAFTDCTARGAYHDNGAKYWNGDGFCVEGAVRGVTFDRCAAYDNTDGGWDLKATKVRLTNCVAVGNKRNYRFWSGREPMEMVNCLSAFPVEPRRQTPGTGVWVKAGGAVKLSRCTLWADGKSLSVEDGTKEKPTTVIMERCLVRPAEGGEAIELSAGVDLRAVGSVIHGRQGAKPIELKRPDPAWRGRYGDDAFDATSHPREGYLSSVRSSEKQPKARAAEGKVVAPR